MKSIRKVEYSQPTPIQAGGIPVALSGRDLIGSSNDFLSSIYSYYFYSFIAYLFRYR